MGVWSTEDLAVTEQAMTGTASYVAADGGTSGSRAPATGCRSTPPSASTGLLLDFLADGAATRRVPAA